MKSLSSSDNGVTALMSCSLEKPSRSLGLLHIRDIVSCQPSALALASATHPRLCQSIVYLAQHEQPLL